MKTLGVGVIGVGFWGSNHARVYNEIKKARLIGVSDLDKARAKDLARKFKCGFYEKNHQLLKDDKIDVVSICTPTSTHFRIALQAIENGKHVLVEKPLGRNLKESVKIVKEAEKKGVKLTVGHIERFNPAVQKLKELVEEGTIGDIILILSRRVTRWPERIGDVGVVKDSAIHDIDVMRYILEDDVIRVYAKVGKLKHSFEDYAEALLHFNKGGTGFIDSNWLTPKKIRNLIVTGSEATASLDYLSQQISIESSKFVKKVRKKWREPLKLELNHFVEVVLDNKEPCVTGLDGIKAIQICESIIKSGASGKVINLKPIAI